MEFPLTMELKKDVCRLCSIKTAEKENDLFQENNIFLHQRIKELAGITIENEIGLPRHFCMKCKNELEQAYEFRKRLINAHKYFKQYKKKFNDLIENEVDKNIQETFDTILIPEKVENDAMGSNTYIDVFVASDSEEVNELQEFDYEINEKIESHIAQKKEKPETKNNKDLKFKRKKKPKEPKPEENDNAVICEQCGASFKTIKFLEIHSVRHEEKKFECQICSAKFYLPTELKRHQVSHTGGKQVSCRFCDTKFLNKSNRNRHEKSQHLKLRPFPCNLCGKAFANTHLRKNHMVVHTKERAFNCELCKKSFLRKNHLVTHYKSTAHKKNEMENLSFENSYV